MKNSITMFSKAKQDKRKLTMVTAYDYTTARLVDGAGIDAILVGDSLGNVMLGYENVLPVTVADMVHHASAVCRGTSKAFVVVDMPFMSYQISVEEALKNAGTLIKMTNANAIKLEGGIEMVPQIKAIVAAGIPVMAHLGLTPQSFNALGGYKVQGKQLEQARKLIEDAKAIEAAGAFALVLECVPAPLAAHISSNISIATIGIGAGTGCDGQVLVFQDMLGLNTEFTPKFVKKYLDGAALITQALEEFKNEVSESKFPTSSHSFKINPEVMEQIQPTDDLLANRSNCNENK